MSLDLQTAWRQLIRNDEALNKWFPTIDGMKDVTMNVTSQAGHSQQIVFSNLNAQDPEGVNALKKSLFRWCQQFGECRMSQGNDLSSFELIVTQRVAETKIPARKPINPTYEPFTKIKASIISRAVLRKK